MNSLQESAQQVEVLEGGKKRRGSCKSRSKSKCGNKGCSWHKGVRGMRKGSCNSKPRMGGGETIEGGASVCTPLNAAECKASPGCVYRKSGGKGKKYHKGSCSVRVPSRKLDVMGECPQKVKKQDCDADFNCQYVKGSKKHRGYCKGKRLYGFGVLPMKGGEIEGGEIDMDVDLEGGKKSRSRKSRSRKGKGPCKSRSRNTCGHKGCVFKKSSSRAKAHCSAKGGMKGGENDEMQFEQVDIQGGETLEGGKNKRKSPKRSKKSRGSYKPKGVTNCNLYRKSIKECNADPSCRYIKGTKSRHGHCKKVRNATLEEYGYKTGVASPEIMERFKEGVREELVAGAGKSRSRKSRSRKGPCKSRSVSRCASKGCVVKSRSRRAKAHCSAKGGK